MLLLLACLLFPQWAKAGNNDPYAGQYDVQTTPHYAANAYRQGELIVKLRTENASAPVRLKGVKGKVKANASASALNSLLTKYEIAEVEELMPLTGSMVTPVARRAKSINGKQMPDSDLSSLYVLRFDSKKNIDLRTVAKEFNDLEEVEYAEPNYIVYACSTGTAADYTADPMYSQQWCIQAIGLDKLWDAPVINAKRPIIAILDTGVDITHPDLADNIWTNELEANGAENSDDDSNGFVDDVHGWDFVNQSPKMRDNNGHGTHCAGIAAAVGGNGIGITGANPDALIMPITVMQSDGTGDIATIIKGIDYATANGADILSMSFGGYTESLAERDALAKAYQKAVLVAAAGNDGCSIFKYPMFPAAFSFVLGVEASNDSQGRLASFSNFDKDGPITSTFTDLYNYELRAPGTNIISTFPGGQYKNLNGTSMACPLAAGAISRLLMTREIASKEELFGDLIHTAKGNINIFDTHSLTDADRKPTLDLVTYRLDDEKMGDGDGRPDAGETIRIYPTFRNSWGNARNITYSIHLDVNEDPKIVEFMDDESHFISNLSSYASVEAKNPFIIKISPDCVDGRHISLVITGTCDNIAEDLEQRIVFSVENGVELNNFISEDMTLTPDKYYIVNGLLAVPDGVTLTILPGTTLRFKDGSGVSVSDGGKIIAEGTPQNHITFTKGDLDLGSCTRALFSSSELKYIDLIDLSFERVEGIFNKISFFNCGGLARYGTMSIDGFCNYSGFINNHNLYMTRGHYAYCNIIRNFFRMQEDFSYIGGKTYTNSFYNEGPMYNGATGVMSEFSGSSTPVLYNASNNYYGSCKKEILKNWIWDIENPNISSTRDGSFAKVDLSTIAQRPNYEAPGCVWKVVVDGYDAQDEFDQLPDLGVGQHKFEVYFSKQMNRDATPMVAMGVRPPYTQIAIAEDGFWRTERFPRQQESTVLEWQSSNPDIVTVDEKGEITANKVGKAVITVCDGGVYDSCEITVDHTPKFQLDKDKVIIEPGEDVSLSVFMLPADIDESASIEWTTTNEAVATVDKHGVVTGVMEGEVEITAKIGDYMAVCMVIVSGDDFTRLMFECHNRTVAPGAMPKLYVKLSDDDLIDVYTAYLTIKGSDSYDGLNGIYVGGAEDLEYFSCPIEDFRYHVNVQSAGTMSSGFMAEAGVGKVTLTWENAEENFDDMLGYNLYRYTLNDNYEPGETIRINEKLLVSEEFVDYDIVPGTTYNYYYKVLRTSLDENSPSKVVSATPRAAGKGDANASGNVDVADVVTEVNYMVGRDPKPFIFEAADVNDDTDIDILDVVGTVNIIMAPEAADNKSLALSVATYSVENGILYVDCPIELAGVQAELNGSRDVTEITVLPALRGMENTGDWVSDESYRFVAFSLSGKTLESGRHALLSIGDAELSKIILVDADGNQVMALEGSNSGISSVVMQQMKAPTPNPFVDVINVPVIIGTDGNHAIELSMHDLSGAKMLNQRATLGYGEHNVVLNAGALPRGFYLLTLTVDGKNIQTHKVIKK